MARFHQPSEAEIAEYQAWLVSRDEAVRSCAMQISPWELYRVRPVNLRGMFRAVRLVDGQARLTFHATSRFNLLLAHSLVVIEATIDDIEPCDLPGPGELLGVVDVPVGCDGRMTMH